MRVFLDVGAHTGETLRVVQDPRWGFERIISFEPASVCWPQLEAIAGSRSELCQFGLWSCDDEIVLHNPGAIGASLSASKDDVRSTDLCEFRDAAAWFDANIAADDEVYAKINAEGAEAGIIDRLAQTGQLSKIDHLLIHFDVRKIPGRSHEEAQMRRQLASARIEFHSADRIQYGGVYRGTRNWLRWCQGNPRTRNLRFKVAARVESALRRRAYPLKVLVNEAHHRWTRQSVVGNHRSNERHKRAQLDDV